MDVSMLRSKQKKIKSYRPKLKVFRSSEPLKSVLMWGINYSHNALLHVKPHAVFVLDDFKSFLKIKASNHNFDRENMPSKYKYKEYSPMVFEAIRRKFKVDPADYLESFTYNEPEWDRMVGKSGSKFMVTYNRHYVIKTIQSDDLLQLQSILEKYYEYIVQCSGNTLLPQFLGLYRVTVSDQETYLLVMRNVFSPRLAVHSKYDLKGTSVDREANEKEKNKPMPTLKDTDFLNEMSKINVGPQSKADLMRKLERDIQFLEHNNLTNYSVLVGVHDLDSPNKLLEQASVMQSDPGVTSDQEDPRRQSIPDPVAFAYDLNQLRNKQNLVSAGDGMGAIVEVLKRQGVTHQPQSGPVCLG
ncbi:Phosphatidylinositol 5-phosphate 4-kinase type-2 alpha, partial [Cichlidogyrus casuarinus]